MTDSTLEIQKSVIATLKADADVAALVSDRVWDEPDQAPTYPFVEIGDANGDPFDADGMVGWEAVIAIRCWSRAPGRVEARRIMAAIKAALHDTTLTLDTQTFVLGQLTDQRDLKDSDGESSGGFQRFRFITHEP